MSTRDRKDLPPPGSDCTSAPEAPHERRQRKEHASRNQLRHTPNVLSAAFFLWTL